MKNAILIGILTLIVVVVGCTQNQPSEVVTIYDAEIANFPVEEISNAELESLNLTINDEYKARATYEKIINKFGEIRPFSNIILSEESHILHLKAIYDKYNLTIPEDTWYDKVPEFDSVQEACQAGVQAETENAALYDSLFEQVDNEDVIYVFTKLRDASLNNHLKAFQRCS
jgi:hypothetical protein